MFQQALKTQLKFNIIILCWQNLIRFARVPAQNETGSSWALLDCVNRISSPLAISLWTNATEREQTRMLTCRRSVWWAMVHALHATSGVARWSWIVAKWQGIVTPWCVFCTNMGKTGTGHVTRRNCGDGYVPDLKTKIKIWDSCSRNFCLALCLLKERQNELTNE